jgi:soluble cytochrome b562
MRMTNLNKLIEQRQGEFEHKIISVDELGHQAHIGDAYKAVQFVNQSITEAYRQALEDVLAGLPGEKEKVYTDDFEMRNYKNGHNALLQTIRAQIEELLGKIE